MPKLVFIDHYDSFSGNVLDWLYHGGFGTQQIETVYWDDFERMRWVESSGLPLVLSPGPNHPQDVQVTCELTRKVLGKVPILGICLGHQILGYVTGAKVVRASEPWHGHIQKIRILNSTDLFSGVPEQLSVMAYNSLVVEGKSLSPEWRIIAQNEHEEIMALKHQKNSVPTFSVQFHPESFLTEYGQHMAMQWHKIILG